jgi:hypothetical protein
VTGRLRFVEGRVRTIAVGLLIALVITTGLAATAAAFALEYRGGPSVVTPAVGGQDPYGRRGPHPVGYVTYRSEGY